MWSGIAGDAFCNGSFGGLDRWCGCACRLIALAIGTHFVGTTNREQAGVLDARAIDANLSFSTGLSEAGVSSTLASGRVTGFSCGTTHTTAWVGLATAVDTTFAERTDGAGTQFGAGAIATVLAFWTGHSSAWMRCTSAIGAYFASFARDRSTGVSVGVFSGAIDAIIDFAVTIVVQPITRFREGSL